MTKAKPKKTHNVMTKNFYVTVRDMQGKSQSYCFNTRLNALKFAFVAKNIDSTLCVTMYEVKNHKFIYTDTVYADKSGYNSGKNGPIY